MNHKRWFCLLSGTVTALGLSSACSIKEPCDPDQLYKYGLCLDRPPQMGGALGDGDGDGTGDGDGDSGGADNMGGSPLAGSSGDGDGDGDGPMPNFGASCEVQEDCLGGLVCGAEQGFPTCMALCGPDDAFFGACPSDTACMDFGVAAICM
jgi:hypothetical protein